MPDRRHLWVVEFWDKAAKAWTPVDPDDSMGFSGYTRKWIRQSLKSWRNKPRTRIRKYVPAETKP